MNDPTVPGAVLTGGDPYWLAEMLEKGRRSCDRIPPRYVDATVEVPEIAAWVRGLIDIVRSESRTVPRVVSGPSLLLVGNTGTGKTYAAYGAIRALAHSGAGVAWTVTTAADLYAQLRPRHRVDSEEEFEKVAHTGVLVLDDLGAAKGSEWNEEINYRLINYRYEHRKPTIITSNVRPGELAASLGERVASRLVEMADRVVLRGPDRRLGIKAVS